MRRTGILFIMAALFFLLPSCDNEGFQVFEWKESYSELPDNPVKKLSWLREAKDNVKAYLDKNIDYYNQVNYSADVPYPHSFVDVYKYEGETYYYLFIQDVDGAQDPLSSYFFCPILFKENGEIYLSGIHYIPAFEQSEEGRLFFSKASRTQRLWSYELIRTNDCGCF
ncbi:hypothetical protein LJC38_06080 [Parabacteroides sp. OttesenSCG-928-K15]|nr:hypothetical protein [Parabacteroides sp. OttesenSCG-928-K15]